MNNIFELKKWDFFFAIKPKISEIENLLKTESDSNLEKADDILFNLQELVFNVFERIDYSKYTYGYTQEYQTIKVMQYTRTFEYNNEYEDVKDLVSWFIQWRSWITEYVDSSNYMKVLMLLKALYDFLNDDVELFWSKSPETTNYYIDNNTFTVFFESDWFKSELTMHFVK